MHFNLNVIMADLAGTPFIMPPSVRLFWRIPHLR